MDVFVAICVTALICFCLSLAYFGWRLSEDRLEREARGFEEGFRRGYCAAEHELFGSDFVEGLAPKARAAHDANVHVCMLEGKLAWLEGRRAVLNGQLPPPPPGPMRPSGPLPPANHG